MKSWARCCLGILAVVSVLSSSNRAACSSTKVILVQGLGSELHPPQIPSRFAPLHTVLLNSGFDPEDILFYSYNGGAMNQFGEWVPAAYECNATGQPTVTSRERLRDMINDYHDVHPDATFYIVGHSLGGLISFLTLGEVVNGNIPIDVVKKVITVDSPLEGANTTITTTSLLLQLLSLVSPCLDTLLNSAAADEMRSRSGHPLVRESNTALALSAGTKRVAIATFGNIDDCVYNRGDQNEAWRQIIFDAPVNIHLENLGGDSYCGHASYLDNVAIAREVAAEIPRPNRKRQFIYDAVTRHPLHLNPRLNATAAASTTVLYLQRFNVGSSCTEAGWTKLDVSGAGSYMGLFPGAALVQEDPCVKDLSCVWAAIQTSSESYACGGFPAQAAVPTVNTTGMYVWNEVRSPDIPIMGSGAGVNLEFSVYRDLPLERLVFYSWKVRTINAGYPGPWLDRGFVYYGGQKDWFRCVEPVGDLLDLANGTHMNVTLGVVDMCGIWCGQFGTGYCHSHAPLFDNVKVYRVAEFGPQWSIHDIDQFQDTFASDGTLTGTARADMASDISPASNWYSIVPGDSAVVRVSDPVSGLGVENGRAAVYTYVRVIPTQPAKSGNALTQDAVRWPAIGSWQDGGGETWTIIQLDSLHLDSGDTVPDRYCVDLNDNLFTPGDEVHFFYGAVSSQGAWTYASGSNLGQSGTDLVVAAENAAEFSILPIHGNGTSNGDVLYVDGLDGRDGQPLWETAFYSLGLQNAIDRYDVRGPTSAVCNRPASRVVSIYQLLGPYRKILWDTGDLSITLGDGSGGPEKSNDYGLVMQFLQGLQTLGGVYLAGNDMVEELNRYSSTEADLFRSTYIPHSLTAGDHRPVFGVSPAGVSVPGGAFVGDGSFIIYGGCPLIQDFDVITPAGGSRNEITYGSGSSTSTNGAVISNVTYNGAANVGVLLGGFSFAYIADNDTDGVLDRAEFLFDLLFWLGNVTNQPTPVGLQHANSLAQNYPNPFNPQTTIAFSVRDRGPGTLKVYDVAGALVRTLVDEELAAGAHTKAWDGLNNEGRAVASGVYFYKIVAGRFSQTRKMVLLR